MPRRAKGPRLYLDPKERVFVIRDGARKRRTGCGEGERPGAEIALRDYIAAKYQPPGDHSPAQVTVADALTYYLREVGTSHRSRRTTADAADRLLDWWEGKALADVKRSTCRDYVEHRTKQPIRQARTAEGRKHLVTTETARRELTVLRAAINAYHAEHVLDAVPVVTLPEAAPPRDRWLTRVEAARFLRAARAHTDAHVRRALIRFFLIGVYTGSRAGVIRSLAWMPSTSGAWLDLEAGVMHRRGIGTTETAKRRPPLRIPTRLLAHLRRWQRSDKGKPHVIHQDGARLASQRRSWEWVRKRAGLGREVVPHILRHTAATWMMQAGASPWEAAGFLGMSPEMLWRVYGHHHPDWQRDLAKKIGRTK